MSRQERLLCNSSSFILITGSDGRIVMLSGQLSECTIGLLFFLFPSNFCVCVFPDHERQIVFEWQEVAAHDYGSGSRHMDDTRTAAACREKRLQRRRSSRRREEKAAVMQLLASRKSRNSTDCSLLLLPSAPRHPLTSTSSSRQHFPFSLLTHNNCTVFGLLLPLLCVFLSLSSHSSHSNRVTGRVRAVQSRGADSHAIVPLLP